MLKTKNRTDHDPKSTRLADITLFTGCSAGELRQITSLTTEARVVAGRVLCREGAVGREAFVAVDGQAEVTIDGRHIATISAGGFFGEMALLDGGPRVATVTATTPMRLLVLARHEFHTLVLDHPRVAWKLLEGVGARLRRIETDGPLI
jgi:CRP/FNR family transcriptional regulator, cyclic AMP receptor protein